MTSYPYGENDNYPVIGKETNYPKVGNTDC